VSWRHLLSKARGCYQLERFHLAKVRGVTQHVNIHELGHIPVPESSVLLLKCISQGCTLLGYNSALLCSCLALSDATNELPASGAGKASKAVP